ncbi:MAG: hypothetical protein IJU69_02775 [Bacteroidales bacterium]|nr:hypothetical protein [Bacteroidales bacterium]
MTSKARINTAIALCNVLFLVYWAILLRFNRFSQDDYAFMAQIRQTGAFDFVSGVYNNYSGRFVRYFIYWLKYRFLNTAFLPWLYPLFIYIISVASTVFIGRKAEWGKSGILLGILCYNLLILCNLEFCAFFWTAAVDYYATAFLYPLWLYYFCFVCKNRYAGIAGVVLCSLLIGGGCEAHSPLFLYGIFCYALYCFLYKKEMQAETKIRMAVAFVLIAIGFVIVAKAPGCAGRISWYTEKPSVGAMLYQSVKSFSLLVYLIAFRFPFFFILGALCFAAGRSYGGGIGTFDKRAFLFSLAALAVLYWISTFPAAYGMGSFGFHRIYTPEIAVTLGFIAYWCFQWGLSAKCYDLGVNITALCCATLLGVSVCTHIIIDTPIAGAYCESDTIRIRRILEEKAEGRTEDLFLEPLSDVKSYNAKSVILDILGKGGKYPVLYYSNDIASKEAIESSDDPDTAFGNESIEAFYSLPFKIYRQNVL